jgi:hypothetical protein
MVATHTIKTRKSAQTTGWSGLGQAVLVQRKCACGGTAGPTGECEACRKKKGLRVQTKLKIHEPGDIYEQEAERIADQVFHHSLTGAPLRTQCSAVQPTGQMDTAPRIVDEALASPGRPLEPALRQDMEERFGHDFSRVRVHTEAAAAQSAQGVNALAYTVGEDMVFAAGQYVPSTSEGRRLIAHELTHVIQQSGSLSRHVQRDKPTPSKTAAPKAPEETPGEKEARAQVSAIEQDWARVKRIAGGFAETKGWISKGDAVVALVREHTTRTLAAIAAHDQELVNDYRYLLEGDLVAYRYVIWHTFVYQNLARLRPEVDGLISSFDADKTQFTGRPEAEALVRQLKGLEDSLATDSAKTLANLVTDHPIKVRPGQVNEVLITVTSASDKKKRAELEKETGKIIGVQLAVQVVLQHTNAFLRKATIQGVWNAVEAVKEFIEVRNKIIDLNSDPDIDESKKSGGSKGESSETGSGKKEEKTEEKKKDRCYAKYLEQTAYCGETYTDDTLYDRCMANAWKNYIRCLNGLPPLPLVPTK